MHAGSLPGWANVCSSPAIGDGAAGTSLRCGIALPRILLVLALLFFLGPLATPTEGGSLANDLRLQEKAKALEKRQKSIRSRRPPAHLPSKPPRFPAA